MLRSLLCSFAVLAIAGVVAQAETKNPVPRSAMTAGMKQAKCSLPFKEAAEGINVEALDGKLKLVELPCWRAAYQAGSIFFAVDPAAPGKARLLQFEYWGGKKRSTTFSLTLPDFSADTKTLMSFNKGRGVGDCGSIGEWVWSGSDFKLTGFWVKDDCDGEPFDEADDKDKWRVFPPKR